MSPRNSVILALLILVVLGAYFYMGPQKEEETPVSGPPTLVALESDQVREIVIERANGTVIRLERDERAGDGSEAGAGEPAGASALGQGWRLVEPLEWKADAMRVSSMLNVLRNLRAVRNVTGQGADGDEEDPEGEAAAVADPEAYGLANPSVVITARTADGEFSLRVGEPTPVGQTVYAQVAGDPAVYTVSMVDVLPFLDTVPNYRDRTIVSVASDQARRLQIETANAAVTLEREGDTWNLVEPLHHPADPQEVNNLLGPFAFLQAHEFIDNPGSLSEYGLDEPQAVVRLTAGEGEEERTHVVYIGAALEDERAYVKTDGPTVYVVQLDPEPFAQVSAVGVGLKDIVLTNDIFTPQIELISQTGLSLMLIKNEDENRRITWRRGDGQIVEPSKMTEFLGALIAIDSEDLGREVDDVNAVDLNYVTIRMQAPPGESPEGWPRVVRFGRPSADGTVEVVVNTRNRVYTTKAEVLETLLERARDIADTPVDEDEEE